MYNEASQPYISVSEVWDGINRQKQHLEETNYNTMIFDFPQKYLLNNAIVKGSYSLLKKNINSFRGQGLERYAVTFVDNHDTFERDGYGDNQFGGQYCDLSTATVKANVLQAYAYILSMPGIPCVFYPHWTTYRQEINQMIRIRKLAGIHSESKVLEETSGGYSYSGTIQGRHRKLIVRVGKNRDTVTPVGYWKIMEGDHYSLFIESGEGIEELTEETFSNDRVKILENGRLMIRVGEKLYDATGRLVR
jgi:alpha-amylase